MSLDDMSDTIEDFAEPVIVTRRPARGTLVGGRYVPDDEDAITLNITAVVTPAIAKDLLRLPEGRRLEQVIAVRTATPIQLLPDADVITWNGVDWEFERADSFESFYDCLATRNIDQDNTP